MVEALTPEIQRPPPRRPHRRWLLALALLPAACSSNDPQASRDAGEDTASGGAGTGGGVSATGGAGTGGISASGGAGTGGVPATGGAGTGGISASGGDAGSVGGVGTGGSLGKCSAASPCATPLVCGRHDGPVCVDPAWAAWPMPNDAKSGAPNIASYTDNGDDTITDNVTGLIWQKASTRAFVWNDAIPYCSTLTLAGHDDWRLPTRIELISIVDLSQRASSLPGAMPAIDAAFGTTVPGSFWSSSTFADDPAFYAWLVSFSDGSPQTAEKVTMGYSRCVR